MTPMRANISQPPPTSAALIRFSIAVCHSSSCCSVPGSFWIYLAASLSVTSWRPHGSGIGSSNSRAQPRLLMAPTPLVELSLEPLQHPDAAGSFGHAAIRPQYGARNNLPNAGLSSGSRSQFALVRGPSSRPQPNGGAVLRAAPTKSVAGTPARKSELLDRAVCGTGGLHGPRRPAEPLIPKRGPCPAPTVAGFRDPCSHLN
jgi:hypothetical protein